MTTPAEREAATAALLVARAKAGEPQAFDALVRRYRKRIFAFALHLTGSESEADDIVQDVFLRAYRKLDQFEGRSEFFTWVYRLTLNRALDARRARARRSESSIDETNDPRIERAIEVDAPGDPRRAAELRQTYARVLRALDALPPEMCVTVVLVALQGLSNAEAAVVQGCSRGTIGWRLHEGRRRLLEATSKSPKRAQQALVLSERLGRLLEDAGLPALEVEPVRS
ncbi:MAG: sigma-70 family RNA polymerase sigma factor [Deltaproteobacteria bacterium]|nr:sigma-70 family RNA polymerase sigma factor [Deltaproteobacteria bacterium]